MSWILDVWINRYGYNGNYCEEFIENYKTHSFIFVKSNYVITKPGFKNFKDRVYRCTKCKLKAVALETHGYGRRLYWIEPCNRIIMKRACE